MKKSKNFWFLFSAACIIGIIGATYKAIEVYIETKKISVASSNEDLYSILKEPLIQTVMYNGVTLHGDGENAQVFEYAFKCYMTDLPYRITLSRNAQFEDCAGCIGDWQIGMFSHPEYNGDYISLKEFIIQMVHAKNENTANTTMVWNTSGYVWKVTPTKEDNQYLIEVTSSSDRKWEIRA